MVKPTLTQKLFFGYLLMVALTFFVGVYTAMSLHELRRSNQEVVEIDLPLIDAVHEMIETLSMQDLYARKYAILKDQTTEELFWSRNLEFEQWLGSPAFKQGSPPRLHERILQLHSEYVDLFNREVAWIASKKEESDVNNLLQGPFRTQSDEQVRILRLIEQRAREDQQQRLLLTDRRSRESWILSLIVSLASLGLGLGFASFATHRIGRSIQQLKETATRIGRGEFDGLPPMEAEDVVGDLGEAIRRMSRQLKELGEMKLDANPLTQLPGNMAVERELLDRLRRQKPFAFCYIDLKDFKAFGDRYGYARGSDVLMRLSQILLETVRVLGKDQDFVGHIGGDDFVLITEPQRVQPLSERIISEFDRLIPSYYDREDYQQGYIVSRNRKNIEERFPIMTISIAVVTNERTPLQETSEVAEIAAQLKHYAKSFEKSAYVVQKKS